MKYRKKPIEIEAVQWDCSDVARRTIMDFPEGRGACSEQDDGSLKIATREGVMRADYGDWIIQGVQGELYPCKPDIFEATYEVALPDGFRPPRVKRPEGYVFGLTERVRTADGSSMSDAVIANRGGEPQPKATPMLKRPNPNLTPVRLPSSTLWSSTRVLLTGQYNLFTEGRGQPLGGIQGNRVHDLASTSLCERLRVPDGYRLVVDEVTWEICGSPLNRELLLQAGAWSWCVDWMIIPAAPLSWHPEHQAVPHREVSRHALWYNGDERPVFPPGSAVSIQLHVGVDLKQDTTVRFLLGAKLEPEEVEAEGVEPAAEIPA